ncbi:phosphoglycerate dehydrogenase [Rhodopseudomonas sp. BR0M22]|uniref:phosphoglycerate dehydrogenase n=1 Tax=Rhodopseudomonas sp. BR0M22 TaxID=2269369 RepID=UPI0013E0E1A9|nr:phosphoglycerate dehydrogenase [Rhodopseudomonas sp. BR0M22]NEW90737.1 hydroxyacid dehydrogenase [Rhodopseudomonas sp. BR0M22]
MTTKHKVLVTTRFFDDAAEAYLRQHGCSIVTAGLPHGQTDVELSAARLHELLAGVSGWVVGVAPVTREVLAASPELRVIARRGVGYDNVDVAAAKEFGKVVTIAAGGNEASVADHAIAMMLALAKRLRETHERMTAGHWIPLSGSELYRKTVGLVGLGRIARGVAQRLRGFEAKILTYDVAPDLAYAESHDISVVDLPTLLSQSDYVSLHLPLLPQTAHLIDAAALALMKPSAILINTARGGLIDEAALLAALQDGRIAGAGLDVFEAETDSSKRPTADALLGLPNVIASPHAGGASREALARANLIAAQTVIDVLDNRTPAAERVVVDGR